MNEENSTFGEAAVKASASVLIILVLLILVFGLFSPLFLSSIYAELKKNRPIPPKNNDDLLKEWNETGKLLMGSSWDDPKHIEWRNNLISHPKPNFDKKIYQEEYTNYKEKLDGWKIELENKKRTATIIILIWWMFSIGIFSIAYFSQG